MLRRKMMANLIEWQKDSRREVLLIKGQKQVGKTTLIDRFGKENYTTYIKLDFEKKPELKALFEGTLNKDTILKKLSLLYNVELHNAPSTLIFMDEVHLCPNARLAAKALITSPKIHVILSTSYFETNMNAFESDLLPHEKLHTLNGLSFEEFLWAIGISDQTITDLYELYKNKENVPIYLHDQTMEALKDYMLVGGMPASVSNFIEMRNYKEAESNIKKIEKELLLQTSLLLSKPDYAKTIKTYNSISNQLEKDNKKFQYGLIEYRSAARKYENNLLWLYYADLIDICFNVNSPKLPLQKQAKFDIFKVYFKDLGTLMHHLGAKTQKDILLGNFHTANDAILESFIADVLVKNGHKLFYYTRNTTLEADFIINMGGKETVLQVKNADNTKSKMLVNLKEQFDIHSGIKLSLKNEVQVEDFIVTIPIYMAMFL